MKLPTLFQLLNEVKTAASNINEHFDELMYYDIKGDRTPVTVVDTVINNQFKAWAVEHQLGFIGEEGNGIEVADHYLYVDPLDGTGAFLRGMATSTIVVSIMKRHGHFGIPIMSVIHNPITGQTWTAEKDGGAFYSRRQALTKTSVQHPPPERPALITLCMIPDADERFRALHAAVEKLGDRFSDQQMGAFALGGGLIASGHIHATAISATSAVETAAMSLIVSEAGGVCVDLRGKTLNQFEFTTHKGKRDFVIPHGAILASNAELATAIVQLYGG
ncbi:MAG TPA: inositol monophosphatase family protein [Candidatus Paceibacterota bacterium]